VDRSSSQEENAGRRRSSWTLDESEVESCEYQGNSYIDYQPFPEPVSEEQEIHAKYDGYQQ
jgi:hypothetical protein